MVPVQLLSFSLIPANNASGNFTKVTQRIPVRISIESADNNQDISSLNILSGMSAVVKIIRIIRWTDEEHYPTGSGTCKEQQFSFSSKHKSYKWFLLANIMIGTFMAVLDATIVNVGLPKIMASFGVGLDKIEWVITAYMLAMAVVLPTSGWLADKFGYKRIVFHRTVPFHPRFNVMRKVIR